jgi:hypothetical protein
MAVTLNERAFEYAKTRVNDGGFVYDDRDGWSEHQPSAAEENHFIEEHGFDEYARVVGHRRQLASAAIRRRSRGLRHRARPRAAARR